MMLSAMPMVAASPLDLLAREPISELSVHFVAARAQPLGSLGRGADPAAQFTWSRRGPRRSVHLVAARTPPLGSLGRGADPAARFTWSRRGPRRSVHLVAARTPPLRCHLDVAKQSLPTPRRPRRAPAPTARRSGRPCAP